MVSSPQEARLNGVYLLRRSVAASLAFLIFISATPLQVLAEENPINLLASILDTPELDQLSEANPELTQTFKEKRNAAIDSVSEGNADMHWTEEYVLKQMRGAPAENFLGKRKGAEEAVASLKEAGGITTTLDEATGKETEVNPELVRLNNQALQTNQTPYEAAIPLSGENPMVIGESAAAAGDAISSQSGKKVAEDQTPETQEEIRYYNCDTNASAAEGESVDNKMFYADLWKSTDLLVTTSEEGVKEDIILKDSSAPTYFDYIVETVGLELQVSDEGGLSFLDSTGGQKFYTPPPNLTDADGKKITSGLRYRLGWGEGRKEDVKVVDDEDSKLTEAEKDFLQDEITVVEEDSGEIVVVEEAGEIESDAVTPVISEETQSSNGGGATTPETPTPEVAPTETPADSEDSSTQTEDTTVIPAESSEAETVTTPTENSSSEASTETPVETPVVETPTEEATPEVTPETPAEVAPEVIQEAPAEAPAEQTSFWDWLHKFFFPNAIAQDDVVMEPEAEVTPPAESSEVVTPTEETSQTPANEVAPAETSTDATSSENSATTETSNIVEDLATGISELVQNANQETSTDDSESTTIPEEKKSSLEIVEENTAEENEADIEIIVIDEREDFAQSAKIVEEVTRADGSILRRYKLRLMLDIASEVVAVETPTEETSTTTTETSAEDSATPSESSSTETVTTPTENSSSEASIETPAEIPAVETPATTTSPENSSNTETPTEESSSAETPAVETTPASPAESTIQPEALSGDILEAADSTSTTETPATETSAEDSVAAELEASTTPESTTTTEIASTTTLKLSNGVELRYPIDIDPTTMVTLVDRGGRTFAPDFSSGNQNGEYSATNNPGRISRGVDASLETSIPFSVEASYLQEDLKQTCVKFIVDTANTSGHFANTAGTTQTVGSGNTCSRIIIGDRFQIGSDFFTITSITGNGSANNGVTFSGTKATGTYDVAAVYASQFSNGVVKLNGYTNTCGTDTVTDGGYTYNTVQIGNQCWLKQNIKKGSMLASVSTLPTNNSTVEKWCYDNASATCDSEGGLYTWDEAMGYSTTAGSQGICPTGYHIPTDAQQYTLESYLATGTCDVNRSAAPDDCDPAGTKLQVGGTSGFEGTLTGYRYIDYTYKRRSLQTFYWSSTQSDASNALIRYLYSGLTTVGRYSAAKANGFSIRCVMDTTLSPITTSLYNTSITATSTDTSGWSDIHSASITETLNSANSYYSVSFNGRNSFKVYKSSTWRVIASNQNSDTGGTNGVWYYRDNSSTWAAAYANTANAAVSQAVAAGANNQMAKATIEGISDASWEATGGFANTQTTLDVATTLYSTSAANNPQVDNVSFSYDVASVTKANTASATLIDASGDSFAGNATTTSQDWSASGAALSTDKVGAKASFTTATSTEIWAGLDYSAAGGIVKATIDKNTSNEVINYIDTYAATTAANQKTLLATALANSAHTVEIELTAKKNSLSQNLAPLAYPFPPYQADSYAKLLLHADGANGSTTFTDSETTPKTVTAIGNAQISTAQSKLGNASGLFDGAGDYLSISDSDDFNFGSGDFTIETWINFNSLAAQTIYEQYVDNTHVIDFWLNATTGLSALIRGGSGEILFNQGNINGWAINTWYHVALVRNGSAWNIYRNGISIASTTNSNSAPDLAAPITIGTTTGTMEFINGYIDEVRISKGIARYTANFTPLPSKLSLNYIEAYPATTEVAATSIVGAADSGSVTTLTDDALIQTENYFVGYSLTLTSGANNGKTVYITGFDAGTDTLTFAPALSTAITTESYQLTPDGIQINSRAARGINLTSSATANGAEFGLAGNLPVDANGKAKQGTWSSWVKPNFAYNADANQHYIFDTGLQRLYYDGADDKWHFSIYNGSDWSSITITSASQGFAANTSIHLAASWNATSGIKLWVNGAKVSSALTWTAQTPNTSNDLVIGADNAGANYFDGVIAEPQMWDYILGDSEIYSLYTSVNPSIAQAHTQKIEETQKTNKALLFNASLANTPNDRVGSLAGSAKLSATQSGTVAAATSFINSTNTGNVIVNDSYTKLLLHADGINNSINFIDAATTPKTVTAVGDAKISTTQSKFGGSSAAFDGTGDYLTTPDSDDFEFSSGDFTIEFWSYASSYGSKTLISKRANSGVYGSFLIYDAKFYASSNGSSWDIANAVSMPIPASAWNHVAVVRSGNNIYLFVNGILKNTVATTSSFVNNSDNLYIGGDSNDVFFSGYLDDIRISKGIARYTANFTPPTSPSSKVEYSSFTTAAATTEIVGGFDVGPDRGIARITLDEGTAMEMVTEIDTYAAAAATDQRFLIATGLPSQIHTVKIEAAGIKNISATAVDVEPKFIETNPTTSVASASMQFNNRIIDGVITQDFATLPNAIAYPDKGNISEVAHEGTFEAWVQTPWAGDDGVQHQILDTRSTATNFTGLTIAKGVSNTIGFSYKNISASPALYLAALTATDWAANTPHHIVARWWRPTPTTMGLAFYLDGKKIIGGNITVTPNSHSQIAIGTRPYANSETVDFDGQIYDASIYSYAFNDGGVAVGSTVSDIASDVYKAWKSKVDTTEKINSLVISSATTVNRADATATTFYLQHGNILDAAGSAATLATDVSVYANGNQATVASIKAGSFARVNNASGVTATDTSITVDSQTSVNDIPAAGFLYLGNPAANLKREKVYYSSYSAGVFSGIIRGVDSTLPTTWADNTIIEVVGSVTLASAPATDSTLHVKYSYSGDAVDRFHESGSENAITFLDENTAASTGWYLTDASPLFTENTTVNSQTAIAKLRGKDLSAVINKSITAGGSSSFIVDEGLAGERRITVDSAIETAVEKIKSLVTDLSDTLHTLRIVNLDAKELAVSALQANGHKPVLRLAASSEIVYEPPVADLNPEVIPEEELVETPEATPFTPTSLTSSLTTTTTATLTWVDNDTAETGYTLQHATDSGFTANLVTHTLAANITTYADTDLSANTTYYYRVKATAGGGDSTYASTNFKTAIATLTPSTTHPAYSASPASPTSTTLSNFTTTIFDTAAYTSTATDDTDYKLSTAPVVGYEIPYSARFDSARSTYLSRTPSVAGNGYTFTYSAWVKNSDSSFYATPLEVNQGTNSDSIFLQAGAVRVWFNGATSGNVVTTALLRDPSQFFHLVVAVDTTQAIASNRVKIYIDGIQQTSLSAATYPAQNYQSQFNRAYSHQIAKGQAGYSNYYLADTYFIDGQALTPASFGATDAATGRWIPKSYSGTYGTNGFKLNFANSSALGTDVSGNSNTFTSSGLTTADQFTDTPTKNFATLNPVLQQYPTTGIAYSEGALVLSNISAVGGMWPGAATMAIPATGKWYFEFKLLNTTNQNAIVGLGRADSVWVTYGTGTYRAYNTDGTKIVGRTAYDVSAYGATWDSYTNTIGVAVDMDAGTLHMYKNNVDQGELANDLVGQMWIPFGLPASASEKIQFNFGANGFTYTPPTGFLAINSQNLPTPAITKPNTYFDAVTYTGTGATQNITSFGFQPDLVIIKNRSQSDNWKWIDSTRGVTKSLSSNTNAAEATEATGLTAFLSNGFTLGAGANGYNDSGENFVAYGFKKGATPGFDIVSYSGNYTARTIAHGLGAAPEMMIVKNQTGARGWWVYHKNLNASPQGYEIYLDGTSAAVANATVWNNTAPTSSVFSLGASVYTNESGYNFAGYLFRSVAGFSSFGSYTGNGNADGPFVYTGFKPRFLMVKNINNAYGWVVWDSSRAPYNLMTNALRVNLGDAEVTGFDIDFLSNGFKMRDSELQLNASSNTFIYVTFADTTMKQPALASAAYASQLFTYDTSAYDVTALAPQLIAYATANAGNGITAKIWNKTNSAWDSLTTLTNTSAAMPTAVAENSVSSNLTDYVDTGIVRVLVYSTNPSDTAAAANLYTDLAKLQVFGVLLNAAPNSPTLVSPSNASYTADTTPTLSASYSDSDAGDTGTTSYRIASTSAADCLSNTSVVASGASAATATNSENTTWTPASTIGNDGTYYWCAQNNDGAATSSWVSMGSFILDATAPATGSASSADGYQTSTTIAVSVSRGADGGSGLSITDSDYTLEYAAATLANGSCGSYGSWTDTGVTETAAGDSYNFTATSGNCYQFRYTVKDVIGNSAVFTSSTTTKVDTAIPTGGSVSSTDGYLTSTTIPVSVDRGSDAASGFSITASDYTLEYQAATLTGGICGSFGSWTDASVTETAAATSYDFTATSGNCYTFRYTVKDAAGNSATFTSTTTTKVDTATPNIVAITTGADSANRNTLTSATWFTAAALGNDDTISAAWTNPASTSGDTYYYEINTTATETITGDELTTTTNHLDSLSIAEGISYLHIKPINGANTSGVERIFTLQYDATGPTVSLSSAVADSTTQITATSATASDSGAASPYTYDLLLYSGATCSGTPTESAYQAADDVDYVFTSLTPNTVYSFKVKAKDSLGNEGNLSVCVAAYTIASQVTAAATTANYSVANNYYNTLTWTNAAQTGMKVERDAGCDGSYETTVYDSTAANATSPYTDADLAANTCYQYRISSYNGDGILNSVSIPVASDTTPPAIPASLTNTANTASTITFDWDDTTAATSYKVYSSVDSYTAAVATPVTSTWQATEFAANSQYCIKVTAVNTNGEGGKSSYYCAYASADTPTNAGYSATTTSSLTWSWQSGGSQKDYYALTTSPVAASGWITATTWLQNSNLAANNAYTVYIKARNEDLDETSSISASAYTAIEAATDAPIISSPTTTSLTVAPAGSFSNLNVGSAGLYFANTTASVNSGWRQTETAWENTSLSPNTSYTYQFKARNGDGAESGLSATASLYTLAATPATPVVGSSKTANSLSVVVDANGNPAATNYQLYVSTTNTGNPTTDAGEWSQLLDWTAKNDGDSINTINLNPNTTYYYKLRAKNGNNVATEWSATGSAYTLAAAPAISEANSHATSTWYPAASAFAFQNNAATGEVAYYRYIWNNTAAASFTATDLDTCAEGTNWNPASNLSIGEPATTGEYTLHIISCNSNAEVATLAHSGPYYFDAESPTTSASITAGTLGNSDWYTTNPTATITPADATSGIASTLYCADTANTCTPTLTYASAIALTTEGTNYLRYASTDAAGNTQTTQSLTIKLDKTSPTTSSSITAGTLGNSDWYTTNATATITPADATSGIASTLYCVDTANTCNPETTYSEALAFTTEGTNYLRYASTDAAGNTQATQSLTVKVDKTSPATGSTSSTDGYLTSTTIPVAVDRGSDAASGFSTTDFDYTLEYQAATLTGGICGSFGSWTDASVTETAAATSYDFTATSGNCYTFRYTVKDAAGNSATFTSTTTTKVDTATPNIVAITTGADSANRNTLTSATWFTAAALGNDDTISAAWTNPASTSGDTYYYEINTTATETITGDEITTTTNHLDSLAIAEGISYLHIKPINGANTSGVERIFTLQYDKSNPTTSASITAGTLGNSDWYTTNPTATITPADATSGIASTLYCLDTANTCSPNLTYSAALTILDEGINYLRYASTDAAGNTQTTQSLTIYLDKTSPASGSVSSTDGYLTSTTIPVAVNRGADSISGFSAGASDYTLEYAAANLTAGSCGSYGSWVDAGVTENPTAETYDFTATSGNCYTFRYTVKDTAGNSATFTSSTTTKVDTATPDIVSVDAGASAADRISLTSATWFNSVVAGGDDAVSFTWSNPASPSGDTYYYEINTTATDSITGDEVTTTTNYLDAVAISEGISYLHIKPVSGANTSGVERIFTLKYDKSNPTATADTLTNFNSGGTFSGNRSYEITWNSADFTDATAGLAENPITLAYSTDGETWNQIATGEANDGAYTWLTPDITNSAATIKISASDAAGNTASDTSAASFAISASTNFNTLYLASGNNQTAGMNELLADEFKVRVSNGADSQEVFAGADAVTVTFTIAEIPATPTATGQSLLNGTSGGSFAGNTITKTVTTDADGYASVKLQLGDRAGDYIVVANFTGCTTPEANRTFTATEKPYFRFTLSNPNLEMSVSPTVNPTDTDSVTLSVITNAASYQINLTPIDWVEAADGISNWNGSKGFAWDNNATGTAGGVNTPTAFSGLDTPTDAYVCSGDSCQGNKQFTLDFHTTIDFTAATGVYQNNLKVEAANIAF